MTLPRETAMPDAVLHIEHFTKRYGALAAVDGLSLSLPASRMLALVGPDGAGKTTLIRTLCGILSPDGGSARVCGYDVATQMDRIKPLVGYLSQKFSMYGDLSIDENIEFFAEIHGVRDFRQRREELLDVTRLAPFRGRLAERLSGGMKQKLALACTLVHTPTIVFLDEPTTGVDPVSRRDFWRILSGLLRTGLSIVLTTPYMDEAERCSLVGMMNHGTLMVYDTPDAIKSRMQGNVIELVCADARSSATRLSAIPAVREVQTFGDRLNIIVDDMKRDWPIVRKKLEAQGESCAKWREITPSLENVFIGLMKQT